GLLSTGAPRFSRLADWISALSLVLSVWSKQTLLPVIGAAVLFLWIKEGPSRAFRYAMQALAGFAVVLSLTLILVPAQAFFFNTITLATHRPNKPAAMLHFVEAFRRVKLESLVGAIPVAFFLTHELVRIGHVSKLREFVNGNRWLVFL